MTKRPALTEESFLKHLFSPKANPLPTGIRKTSLKGTQGGRTRSRVTAFNRMSAASQEILRRAGLRDAYLRKEATLADARKALRHTAVGKGIARPPRVKAKPQRAITNLDAAVARHVIKQLRDTGKDVNADRLYSRVPYLPEDDKEDMLRWPAARIRAYGADANNQITVVEIDTKPFNPLWYH